MECNPHELTILYTTDTRPWCEYLFDIFKDFDILQNSEDVTEWPTIPATLQNIRNSLVTLVIISPVFIQECTSRMEEDLTGGIVGLICGVDEADLNDLYKKVPSAKSWHYLEAVAGTAEISRVVLKILGDIMDERKSVEVEIVDTYGSFDEGACSPSSETQEDLYEPMMAIPTSMAPPVPAGTDHVFTPTSIGYVDMSKAKHSPHCSAGLTICPEKSRSGEPGVLHILFNEPKLSMRETDQYNISFQGKLKKSVVAAQQKNPYTLQVDLPKDHPAELTDVEVTGPGNSNIGTFKFVFKNVMDDLAEILRDVGNPLDFMCQSLGISSADANELDNKLYEHFQRCIPAGGLNLLVGQIGGEQKVLTEMPTSLHFAAKYGLKNICSMLINSPGAVAAMKLKNGSGDTPEVLAGKRGHSDLKCFLENFVEVAEDENTSPESGPTSSYMFMRTGISYYNNPAWLQQISTAQSPLYDSPFQVPIPGPGVPLTREETIKKLVQGEQADIEDYYGSFNLDMGSFQRDDDGEEDYETITDQFGTHRKRSTKKITQRRPPPRTPSEEAGTSPLTSPLTSPITEQAPPVPVGPRVRSPSEPEVEALPKLMPQKNVKVEDVLGLQPLPAGQQHLIEIQNRVKNSEVTVDEAVMLFKNWELLQKTNTLSFSTQSETFKALKQQKQKAKEKQGGFHSIFGKKGIKKVCTEHHAKQAQQPTPQLALKPQDRLHIETQDPTPQTNRTSTASVASLASIASRDSHVSRDSSYYSATEEPDSDRFTYPPPVAPAVTRRKAEPSTAQKRLARLSAMYDQLPFENLKPPPPVPSRPSGAKPILPNPPAPHGQYWPSLSPVTSPAEEQSDYIEFEEELPQLPPPRPPAASSEERYVLQDPPASNYPQVTPRIPVIKRPIPKPRNPQK